jgi:hypothetical protein
MYVVTGINAIDSLQPTLLLPESQYSPVRFVGLVVMALGLANDSEVRLQVRLRDSSTKQNGS